MMSLKCSFSRTKIIILITSFLILSCQKNEELNQVDILNAEHSEEIQDDLESEMDLLGIQASSCKRATSSQIAAVNRGAEKLDQFLSRCYAETGSKRWCDEVARPNPSSSNTFHCTYSVAQPHVFVHPTETTWPYAIEAVQLVLDLEKMGIKVSTIYNWWRPEPYNANVGGAAGRHPYGTSIDVRFPSKTEQNKAHKALCGFRKQGRLRALGYYSGTGLHLGIGDKTANTWGKSCS